MILDLLYKISLGPDDQTTSFVSLDRHFLNGCLPWEEVKLCLSRNFSLLEPSGHILFVSFLPGSIVWADSSLTVREESCALIVVACLFWNVKPAGGGVYKHLCAAPPIHLAENYSRSNYTIWCCDQIWYSLRLSSCERPCWLESANDIPSYIVFSLSCWTWSRGRSWPGGQLSYPLCLIA